MKISQLVKAVFSSPLNLMTSNSFADVQDPRKRRRQAMSSSNLLAPGGLLASLVQSDADLTQSDADLTQSDAELGGRNQIRLPA